MNCLSCGAPLRPGELPALMVCLHCGTSRRPPDASMHGDRVAPLDTSSEMDCPRCDHALIQATVDGRRADYCPGCHGILFEAPIFADVVWNRRVMYRGTEATPQPIDPELMKQVIDCPQCQQRMEVHPHYGPGRALIDSCSGCQIVWLDHLELTSLERTPGRR